MRQRILDGLIGAAVIGLGFGLSLVYQDHVRLNRICERAQNVCAEVIAPEKPAPAPKAPEGAK
jgi:hypothetical protein